MQHDRLSSFSRITVFLCGLLLIAVLLVPLWQIELNAPQYPEGLVLKLYPHKIGGNVEIINGLNHYIGMRTLHTEDFIEFKVLPYIIVFYAALCFLVVFLNRRKWLFTLFIMYVAFGIIAMVDFWRWEYNYGHNLDPNAPIVVPGMAYQPPLIGYKQLLNFAAYSIPDIGGFLFIGVGLLLLIVVFFSYYQKKKKPVIKPAGVAVLLLVFSFTACSTSTQPIKIGVDACSYCKMTISDNRFGAELITKKGKVYKFDDTHCVLAFEKEQTVPSTEIKEIYLVNFQEPHDFIPVDKAFILYSPDLRTPMGGNAAAFADETVMQHEMQKINGKKISWDSLATIE